MIDCHTHLTAADFDADREAVLGRAAAAGVRSIAIVGQDEAENAAVLRAAGGRPARERPGLLAFLGLHPDRFAERGPALADDELERICAVIRGQRARLTGIGEVGLDYWVCLGEERRELQRRAFSRMIALALEVDLPLNVHSRSAGRPTLEALQAAGARRVLMHAFDGRASTALPAAEAGYVFSIPPSIVRSRQKQKLVRALPLAALALETDSPVLGPEPGVRNEPANVAVSVRCIAEIKGVTEAEVRAVTSATAARLFGLAGPG
jgi:TatD DNase family protein